MEAKFYKKLNGKVMCTACPYYCKLELNQSGACKVRKNVNGKLDLLVYGYNTGLMIDPIEKKPLFHFKPGSRVLSFGTVGCNSRCKWCQNWWMSQASFEDGFGVIGEERFPLEYHPPEEIVKTAIGKAQGIAYTYNEPTVFVEYALDTAKIAKKKGLFNVFVTNGMTSPEARKEIVKYISAANVDVKIFDKKKLLYWTGEYLDSVLSTVEYYLKKGLWVEVTNLLIPKINDSEELIRNLVIWLKDLSTRIPLHFTAFYPHYKLKDRLPTPPETLEKAKQIALEEGIKYVYLGNIGKGENTYCPNCGNLLIERIGFTVTQNKIKDGKCPYCGYKIDGVFQ